MEQPVIGNSLIGSETTGLLRQAWAFMVQAAENTHADRSLSMAGIYRTRRITRATDSNTNSEPVR